MPRFIAKLGEDKYAEWGTVVDAPVSWVVSYELASKTWEVVRVNRAREYGTSLLDEEGRPVRKTAEEIIAGNRAGRDEHALSLPEILREYVFVPGDPE